MGDLGQRIACLLVAQCFVQHALAHPPKIGIHLLQRIGGELHIHAVQVDQYVAAVLYRPGFRMQTDAQQPEDGQVFVVDTDQRLAGKHKSDRHAVRVALGAGQIV